jgi:hypothetical protein
VVALLFLLSSMDLVVILSSHLDLDHDVERMLG